MRVRSAETEDTEPKMASLWELRMSVPRDNASALEILRLGLSLLGGTWPT